MLIGKILDTYQIQKQNLIILQSLSKRRLLSIEFYKDYVKGKSAPSKRNLTKIWQSKVSLET